MAEKLKKASWGVGRAVESLGARAMRVTPGASLPALPRKSARELERATAGRRAPALL